LKGDHDQNIFKFDVDSFDTG